MTIESGGSHPARDWALPVSSSFHVREAYTARFQRGTRAPTEVFPRLGVDVCPEAPAYSSWCTWAYRVPGTGPTPGWGRVFFPSGGAPAGSFNNAGSPSRAVDRSRRRDVYRSPNRCEYVAHVTRSPTSRWNRACAIVQKEARPAGGRVPRTFCRKYDGGKATHTWFPEGRVPYVILGAPFP